jgi:hypothetical protein
MGRRANDPGWTDDTFEWRIWYGLGTHGVVYVLETTTCEGPNTRGNGRRERELKSWLTLLSRFLVDLKIPSREEKVWERAWANEWLQKGVGRWRKKRELDERNWWVKFNITEGAVHDWHSGGANKFRPFILSESFIFWEGKGPTCGNSSAYTQVLTYGPLWANDMSPSTSSLSPCHGSPLCDPTLCGPLNPVKTSQIIK